MLHPGLRGSVREYEHVGLFICRRLVEGLDNDYRGTTRLVMIWWIKLLVMFTCRPVLEFVLGRLTW